MMTDHLPAFAAHRLGIEADKVMHTWLMPQTFPADFDPWAVNPKVQVFCSFVNYRSQREVKFFTVKYRELVESLRTFADLVKLKEKSNG